MNDDRLGPYRLLRRLGEGGMGVVHLAVDPQGRQVAVKVLRGEVAGDEVARRRLSREVETMRRVRSKYIAEVLDADVTGHRPYIVTRYVPGRPLDEIVKDDGPLDLPALAKIAYGVASALAAVHSVGVIHRDLKPGNVLILDGEPVLIDFGIAQAVDATRLTQTGMFIGTPGYLAPEIIEGQEAGPEVDIHAWAGTLLYAGTGRPPFGKGTLEMVFYNITAGKADVGAAPPELQPLLKAAFQRNPAKRPKAPELAEQCVRLLPEPPQGRTDEITTVPGLPDQPPVTDDLATPPMTPRQLIDGAVRPPASGAYESLLDSAARDQQGSEQQYESLLPGDPDPWPTRRVTPDELRRIQQRDSGPQAVPKEGRQGDDSDVPTRRAGSAGPAEGPVRPEGDSDVPTRRAHPTGPAEGPVRPDFDVPTRRVGPAVPGGPVEGAVRPGDSDVPTRHAHPAGPADGPVRPGDFDVPTRRVRPEALPDYRRPGFPPPAGFPSGPYQGSGGQPAYPDPGAWPGAHPSSHPGAQQGSHLGAQQGPHPGGQHGPYPGAGPHGTGPDARRPDPVPIQPPPYIPAPPHHQPEPHGGGARPGPTARRSRAYGVSSAMLLILLIVAAALAPVAVAAVVIPAVILLRAADLAQPRLSARRAAGSAALDVLRVLAYPAALAKSAGITLALALYALILGLPVTLLLTVVARSDPHNALAWGTAVALWTLCAGPGVEGPGKQMRRTLSSLVPSRAMAVVMAGALVAGAGFALVIAADTFGDNPRGAEWSPLNVEPVVDQLEGLRGNSGG
ncbi:serine/threonine-protein kinase [Nonomuraea maritima]|nr:serine/threonine-protein kinase [Nonomuraea maritima]